jgi:hypothetical protein
MRMPPYIVAICLCTIGLGCAGQANQAMPESWTELVVRFGAEARMRVLLSSAGAARVDIMGGLREDSEASRTILIPCDPGAVARFTQSVAALMSVSDTYALRCSTEGKTRSIGLSERQLRSSELWNGVVREAYAIGHVAIAEAVAWQEVAEELGKKGDLENACDRYGSAVEALVEWGKSRSRRHGVIFEADSIVRPVKSWPDQNYAEDFPAFRAAWRPLAEGIFERANRDDVILVTFRRRYARMWGVPLAGIDDKTLRTLVDIRRSR